MTRRSFLAVLLGLLPAALAVRLRISDTWVDNRRRVALDAFWSEYDRCPDLLKNPLMEVGHNAYWHR